jgi:hypothetical protein
MAYQRTMCANENCPKHSVYSGGEFVYSTVARAFFCKDCFRIKPVMNDGATEGRWNFTTTHFNGHRIEVKGLRHLRELEKEFGCSNHAANHEERNWSTPPPVRPFPVDRELESRLDGRNYS